MSQEQLTIALVCDFVTSKDKKLGKMLINKLHPINLDTDSPSLGEIVTNYLESKKKSKVNGKANGVMNGHSKSKKYNPATEKESSDESSSSEEEPAQKKPQPKKAPSKPAKKESSSEESSDEESEEEQPKKAVAASKKSPAPAKKPVAAAKKQESSSEEESSEEESEEEPKKPVVAAKKPAAAAKKEESSEEESSEEESEDDEPKKPVAAAKKPVAASKKEESSEEESSDEESEDEKPKKPVAAAKKAKKEESSDEDESEEDSDEESEDEKPKKPVAATKKPVVATKKEESSDEESEEESSDEDSDEKTKKQSSDVSEPPAKKPATDSSFSNGNAQFKTPQKPTNQEGSTEESCEVFVNKLAYSVSNEDLEGYFAKFGTVTRARVATDRETGNSRGFAFVTYDSPEGAKKAAENSEHEVEGFRFFVRIAEPKPNQQSGQKRGRDSFGGGDFGKSPKFGRFNNDDVESNEVFVNSLPKNVTSDDLNEYFQKFGNARAKVLTDRETGESRGIAFVTFNSNEEAKKAAEQNAHEENGITFYVRMSRPKPEGGAGGGGGGRGGFRGGRGGRGRGGFRGGRSSFGGNSENTRVVFD